MKVSYILWFSMVAVAPISGQASMLGSWGSTTEEAEVAESATKKKQSRYLHDMIHDERRYVLFNSRRLSGECLDVCVEETKVPLFNEPPLVDSETKSPTPQPSATPTKSPTKSPSNNPTDAPSVSPTKSPTRSPTKSPSNNPTDAPSVSPTKSPTNAPTVLKAPPNTDCENLGLVSTANLGYLFSEATGEKAPVGCFPHIRGMPNNFPDRDDSIGVFVGGNFIEQHAAEVEGNTVVLGDLVVKATGAGNFASVGAGSHVIPNPGGDCIIVGGNIEAERDIQVYNQKTWMNCDIVHKGDSVNPHRWKTNGVVRKDVNYDLSYYENMAEVFEKKSQYWKTLPSTGTAFEQYGETEFQCSANDDIQVFNIAQNEHYKLNGSTKNIHTISFSTNCKGKTILVNVQGTGDISVNAAAMYDPDNKLGYGANGFSTCFTQSLLWNFPDASTVNIGNGKTSEFHGSILAGNNLKLTTTGHSGRAVVLGDLTHERGGSEFHAYPYNPPFPLPDPDDLCAIDLGASPNAGGAAVGGGAADGGAVVDYSATPPPTNAATPPPTNAPVPAASNRCTAIPKNRLPQNVGNTKDHKCAKCHPDINQKWWPCNKKNPPICEGNCNLH